MTSASDPRRSLVPPPGAALLRPPTIHSDAATACRAVAMEMVELVEARPGAVLGVATGSTMTQVYAEFVQRAREVDLDVSSVTCFALDEYLGLEPGHPLLFRSVLEARLVGELGLSPEQLVTPDPDLAARDATGAARAFEEAIAESGGVDLQLLGIGRNGHVAFNEPGALSESRTRVVQLSETTRRDAADRFGGLDQTPEWAITVGIDTIRSARQLRLLAFGSSKAEAVRRTLRTEPTAQTPASLLQDHAGLSVHLDPKAASQL